MSPRPQLLTRMEADFNPCPAWCQSGRPGRPSPAATFLPSLSWVATCSGSMACSKASVVFFSAAKCVERTQLLLLPLQLLHPRQALLVEEEEVPGGVVGGEVGEAHPALLQLLQAAEPGGAQVHHAAQGLHPDHLAFPPGREKGQGGMSHGARPSPPRSALPAGSGALLPSAEGPQSPIFSFCLYIPTPAGSTRSAAAFLTSKGLPSTTSKRPFLSNTLLLAQPFSH